MDKQKIIEQINEILKKVDDEKVLQDMKKLNKRGLQALHLRQLGALISAPYFFYVIFENLTFNRRELEVLLYNLNIKLVKVVFGF